MTAVGHGVTAAERDAPVDGRPTRSWDWVRVNVGLVCGRRAPRTGLSFDRRSTEAIAVARVHNAAGARRRNSFGLAQPGFRSGERSDRTPGVDTERAARLVLD